MNITNELRKWGRATLMPSLLVKMEAIADRIDAEHEGELLETGNDILRDVRREWVLLPKDADGEPIHVGDEVETTNFGTVEVEGFVHRAVAFYNYSEQPAYLCTTPANLCRHHHAPTVEDVLWEFARKMNENLGMYTGETIEADEWRKADEHLIIAEYASKLRLAEGEDA